MLSVNFKVLTDLDLWFIILLNFDFIDHGEHASAKSTHGARLQMVRRMFFRPSYCANCGEKIERVDWHLWTSRRFCVVCESEYRGIDLIPKVFTAIGILGAAFGISSYVGAGQASGIREPITARPFRPTIEKSPSTAPNKAALASPVDVGKESVKSPAIPDVGSVPNSSSQSPRNSATERPNADGPVYMCGAQTKKGTPCSRRVKGNVRCFQHTGMPAMLPPEKLRVS